MIPGTPLASLVVVDLNQDGKLDLVAGTALATGGKTFTLSQSNTADNIYVLTGNNDGSFNAAVPYAAGGGRHLGRQAGLPAAHVPGGRAVAR